VGGVEQVLAVVVVLVLLGQAVGRCRGECQSWRLARQRDADRAAVLEEAQLGWERGKAVVTAALPDWTARTVSRPTRGGFGDSIVAEELDLVEENR
jgi:Na+-transporting methylmalonyl-CoA/oxaloacetate decarboxylase gamma subunit